MKISYNTMKLKDRKAIKENEVNAELVKEQSEKEIKIEQLIREKYSMSQEICMLRKKAFGKITEEELKEWNDYVEECIKKVEDEESQPTE